MIDQPNIKPSTSERRSCAVLTAVFLAMIFIPGAYHLLYGLSRQDISRWRQWLREEKTADALRKIETDFDHRFIPAYVARTLVAGIPVEELHLTAHAARASADGFIFLGDDIQAVQGAGFCSPRFDGGRRAADAIIDFSQQLRRLNIHLVVAPIPAKCSIYPEKLNVKYDVSQGPDLNVDHAQWMNQLRASGVDVIDMTDLFWAHRYDPGELLFHPTDSHWTIHGMSLAADVIAERVGPLLVDLPKQNTVSVRAALFSRIGDLVGMDDTSNPTGSPEIHDNILQLFNDHGIVIPGNDAPVLVIGDSYAALHVDHGGGLSQAIMHRVAQPVQSLAEWAASGNSMRRKITQQVLQRKRVVVMAFTIRLLVSMQRWERIVVPGVADH